MAEAIGIKLGAALYRVNVVVPSGLTPGVQPLAISIGGVDSKTVNLPVQWPARHRGAELPQVLELLDRYPQLTEDLEEEWR
jgi:hypothetical protein